MLWRRREGPGSATPSNRARCPLLRARCFVFRLPLIQVGPLADDQVHVGHDIVVLRICYPGQSGADPACEGEFVNAVLWSHSRFLVDLPHLTGYRLEQFIAPLFSSSLLRFGVNVTGTSSFRKGD